MSKGMVIAGFSGIGKTELAKKYKNVIDLDAAEYVYDNSCVAHLSLERRKGEERPTNVDWPDNYIEEIRQCILKYDLILVWDREDIINEYFKNNIDFIVCYPSKKDLPHYIERYRKRGNSEKYIKMKIKQYEKRTIFFNNLDNEQIILVNNETLEDYLIRNNYELIEK